MLDPADEVRLQPLHRTVEPELGQLLDERFEQADRLQPGEVGAEAEVRATGPERDVRIGLARDVQLVRAVKDAFIPVGRGVPEQDLLAGRDRLTTDLRVSSEGAGEVRHRSHPAQELLDRHRDALRLGAQQLQLFRVLQERDDAAGDEIAGGLAAGVVQQHEEQVQVDLRELLPVDLRRQQR